MITQVQDRELFNELCKAYQYAAPYVKRTRPLIAYFNRPELFYSLQGAWVIDLETGEVVIDAESESVMRGL